MALPALRAIPGWNGPMLVALGALFVVLCLICGGWLRRIRSERSLRPRRWSWNREETICSWIAVLGLVVYVLLTRWTASIHGDWNFDAWRGQIAGPALFAAGPCSRHAGERMRNGAAGSAGDCRCWPWQWSRRGSPLGPRSTSPAESRCACGGLLSAALLWQARSRSREGHDTDRLQRTRYCRAWTDPSRRADGAFAADGATDFTSLKQRLNVSDGAVGPQLLKLEEIGYLKCEKSFVAKPKSTYSITAKGRSALDRYLEQMQAVIDAVRRGE
ncbi:MAG: transcriptional regulator [Planctomycetaceae bacterium]